MSTFLRFLVASLLLVILVTAGTFGYSLIENWSLSDSLYMTFITITTVGFGEVRPLSPQGKQFTVIFLIFSVISVGYSITTLINYVFEGIIFTAMREQRMKRSVKKIKDHYIICGCGDLGREVAMEFKRSRVKFLIIDLDPENSELSRDESILFVKGDAVEDEVLSEANIEQAKGLVSALPDDESNVFVVLTARQINPDLIIVSKAEGERTIRKLLKAGANRVISPSQIAGRRLSSIVLRPAVVNFLDIVTDGEGMSMRIEEIKVQSGSPLVSKTLKESGIGQHTGAVIVGVYRKDGITKINPSSTISLSSITINECDILLALGNEDQLNLLRDFVKNAKQNKYS